MKGEEKIKEKIIESFPNKNKLALPRIEKIIINIGAGKVTEDPKYIEKVSTDLKKISGQVPIKTKSKKSISGFKIRQGLSIGLKVTLRGKRMKDFLSRLINITLPRIRDFRGVKQSAVTKEGNVNIGIREHTVFPEIKHDEIEKVFGLQINIVTTAKSGEEAKIVRPYLVL